MLTISQMADRLGVSAKVFRAEVRRKQIPHIQIGKRMRFDPERVEAWLERFVEISEDNSFPKNFGTGENLIGLPPNDIYQLGFAAAFFECNRAVNQYVNSQADEERRWKRSI